MSTLPTARTDTCTPAMSNRLPPPSRITTAALPKTMSPASRSVIRRTRTGNRVGIMRGRPVKVSWSMPHKLLLADDSVTIQRVIELTFADEDVQVIAVGNGQDAIDRVQRDRPDIILADVGMPERNGYEVAAFAKGNPATAHIPVVLLTGAFEPVDEGRARAVGCDGVLVKPFEPQIVISRVKDLLAGRAPSGMWNAPSTQAPVRQAAAEMDLRAAGPTAAAPTDPLEAYFDRLDAAFASTGSTPSADPFAGAAPASGSPAAS